MIKILEILKSIKNPEMKMVTLQKGQILFHEDDLCGNICVVLEGHIVISSFTYNGNEVVYNSITNGGVFGNNLIFSTDPYYRGNVIAKEESIIYIISKKALIFLMQNNEEFLIEYLKIQSEFGKELNLKIKLLSFQSAEERFLYFLYINKNKITFKNITILASMLFMQRETLSRLISKLEQKKIIIRKKNYILKI